MAGRPRLLRRTLDRIRRAPTEDVVGPGIALFGKHPAWDDHLPPIGLDRPVLETFHRLLYLEGVKGNIDAGSCPETDGSDRLAGRLLMRTGEGFVYARMRPSRDGRDRRRFPLVLGVSTPAAAAPPLVAADELLAGLEVRVSEASTSGTVERAVDALRPSLAEVLGPGVALPDLPDALAALDRHDDGTPEAMIRVLYQLERDLAAYRRTDGRSTTSWTARGDLGPKHCRVPWRAGDALEALSRWAGFLVGELGRKVPFWVITHEDHPLVDLIVGPAGRSEFYCLAADDLVPASEVPYELDPEDHARLADRLGRSAGGGAPAPVEPPARSEGPAPEGVETPDQDDDDGDSGRPEAPA